jgi:hypothetical protein
MVYISDTDISTTDIIAWCFPGGDEVFYGGRTIPIDDFRRDYPTVVLCELGDLDAILEILGGL